MLMRILGSPCTGPSITLLQMSFEYMCHVFEYTRALFEGFSSRMMANLLVWYSAKEKKIRK